MSRKNIHYDEINPGIPCPLCGERIITSWVTDVAMTPDVDDENCIIGRDIPGADISENEILVIDHNGPQLDTPDTN